MATEMIKTAIGKNDKLDIFTKKERVMLFLSRLKKIVDKDSSFPRIQFRFKDSRLDYAAL